MNNLIGTLLSGVIYKYTCAACNCSYIGSTKRYWNKRLEEHLHVSALTGKRLNGLQVFAPLQHVRSDQCQAASLSRDDFQILGRDENHYMLQVKESILICTSKPQLNNNMVSVPIKLFMP